MKSLNFNFQKLNIHKLFLYNRVQTDPGKPGKPEKTVNFEKKSGKLTEAQGKKFFSRCLETQIKTYWHNMINTFLSFALCMLYHS